MKSFKRRFALGRGARTLSAMCLFAVVTACGSPDSRTLSEPGAADAAVDTDANVDAETGSLAFALTVGGSIQLSTFSYAITRSTFQRSGQIDVSNSTKVSAEVADIPVGTGYSVTLTGTSVSTPKAQCSGSATFDVAAHALTDVPIAVDCHLEDVAVAPAGPAPAPIPPVTPGLLGLLLAALGVSAVKKKQTILG